MHSLLMESSSRYISDTVQRVIINTEIAPGLTLKERTITLPAVPYFRKRRQVAMKAFKRLMTICSAIDVGGLMLTRIVDMVPSMCDNYLKGKATRHLLKQLQKDLVHVMLGTHNIQKPILLKS